MLYSILIRTFQCFYISGLNYCRIFCATYSLDFIYILNSLFCCLLVLHPFYFLSFPFFFPYKALFINLYKAFPSLSLFFLLLFFCVLISIYGFNHCDSLNSNTQWIFLVSILASSKVVSSHNEVRTFLYQNS